MRLALTLTSQSKFQWNNQNTVVPKLKKRVKIIF